MGDVASPAYPAPPQQSNALMADPAKAIQLLSGIQDYRIRNQQAEALGQQPGAALAGQNISNATSQMEQNEKASQIAAHYFGSLPDNAKPEDIYKMKAAIRAVHPNISGQTINTVADVALRDPQGLRNGLATLRLMGTSAADQLSRVTGPPTVSGAQTSVTQSQAARAPIMQTNLSPKETAAQTAVGGGAGSAVNEARIHGLNYTQNVFPLEQAIPALESLGKTGTGPGTETLNHVKSFLQSAGVPGFDADKIKNFDEAKKYLTDFINQNGNTQSVEHLRSAFGGSPSVNISNAAATEVAKAALALRRMKQAQIVAFDKSGKPDEEFPKEAGKWMREHDSRVFGFDLMSPDQRKKVLEGLPESKRTQFMMDVQDAVANGVIKTPR